MKLTIKALIISAITTISAGAAVIYTSSSCNVDKCKTVTCANHGVCNKGACTCPTGYVGVNCETENRKRFTGNWSVFEKGSTSLAKQYQVSVSNDDSYVTYVKITNFNNFFHQPVIAWVEGDRLVINTQRLEGKIVWGEGQIYSSVTYGQYGAMSVKYVVQDSVTLVKDDYGYESQIDFSDPSAWNK